MHHRLLPFCLALWLTAALTGCGGGSGGTEPPPAGTLSPKGTILAKVTDTSGAPVAGADVSLAASDIDPMTVPTNAAGEVRFPNVPVGRATLRADGLGFYQSAPKDVTVVAQSEVSAGLTLEPRNPTTAVVLGSRVVSKGTDGKTLEFEVDVAVLDPSGQPLTNLADAAFRLAWPDCGDALCGPIGPTLWGPTGWIGRHETGTGQAQSFALQPARNRSPVALGILLDQGVSMAPTEPQRSKALTEFLAAFPGGDSVLLAESSGSGGSATFTESGGFVNDARSLVPLVQGLPDRVDTRDSDPVQALETMLRFVGTQPAGQPKAVVALTRGDLGCDAAATSPPSTLPSCRRLVELSRAAGIPVLTFPGLFSFSGVDLAQRTGGAAFFVYFPAQYRTAMRGMLSIAGGETPFYRMRFKVTVVPDSSGSASGIELLAAGNTLNAFLTISLNERDTLYADLVVPL